MTNREACVRSGFRSSYRPSIYFCICFGPHTYSCLQFDSSFLKNAHTIFYLCVGPGISVGGLRNQQKATGPEALKCEIVNMTLGCVLDNTIEIDKFKSRPVSEGHVWCIVRFAFSAEDKGGGWLGGSGKTFGRENWESKGKVQTRTDLPRKAKILFGQGKNRNFCPVSSSFDFYVRLSVLHKNNTRLVGGPRIRVRKSLQAFFPPLVGPFNFLIASPSDCEHLLNSWNAYQSLLPTKIICSSADFTSS